jgi:hypothetical protein
MFGYKSYVMLNIYPLRSSSPEDLPEIVDSYEHNKNIKTILDIIKDGSTVWAAWGDSINSHPWLKKCLSDIVENIEKEKRDINWVKMGTLTNNLNPRHPSRLKYQEFSKFNITH